MAAVAGQFAFDGRTVSKETVGRMATSMAHRGPDGISVWADGPVGLAHCAMHTTPEAVHERQPLVDSLSGCVVTADARIDNRDDLLRELKVAPADGEVITDIDLILAAYLRWGTAAPEHLIGDFAFAIWDPREQHLFCARDHIGVRPFYFSHDPDRGYAFASEIKAIFAVGLASDKLDQRRVALQLANRVEDPDGTIYADIRRLQPAHSVTISRSGVVNSTRYWEFDSEYEISYGSDQDYAEHFKEIFIEAIRCRLRSIRQPGVMLSGGLDSSSVACVARDLLRDGGQPPLTTITAYFPDLTSEEKKIGDETKYVRDIEAQGHVDAHFVSMAGASPLLELERLQWFSDQPYYVRNSYIDVLANREANAAGVNVLLDGLEGDDAVGHGYGYLSELAFNHDWDDFAKETIALEQRTGTPRQVIFYSLGLPFLKRDIERGRSIKWIRGARAMSNLLGIPLSNTLWKNGVRPMLARPVRNLRDVVTGHESESSSLLQPELTALLDPESKPDGSVYSLRLRQGEMLRHPAVAQFLEEGVHLGAAGGVEGRHPFYDIRLLKYSIALPPSQKLQNGWTRYVLRQSMKGVLPESVRNRIDKANLGVSHGRRILEQGRSVIEPVLNNNDLLEPYINLRAAREAYRTGRVGEIWPVVQLALWLRSVRGNHTKADALNSVGTVHTDQVH